MPKALDDYSSRAVCDDPGKAMRAVAEKLAARGFDVRSPEWEESGRLTITSAERARCELTVRQHVRAGRRCALCACPGPCDPAHLAASALGAG